MCHAFTSSCLLGWMRTCLAKLTGGASVAQSGESLGIVRPTGNFNFNVLYIFAFNSALMLNVS